MPDFRFVSNKPTVQPNSGYASRISRKVWKQYEAFIRQNHECGSTKDEIQRALENDHGFQPSIGQLRDQMARWGLKSSRKSKTRSGSDREDISDSSISGSNGWCGSSLHSQSSLSSHAFTIVPDESFASMWPQFDMGMMPHNMAIEMEVLADTLFLGGRHIAAFNLYFSIYHAVSCMFKFGNVDFVAAARFRALVGCLRSSANSEQRVQAVSIAEQELKNSSVRAYCEPNDIGLHEGQGQPHEPMMVQFHDRENFREAMARTDNASTVSDVVRKLQIEEGRMEVLKWCFDRLNTPNFIMAYNEQVAQAGSGVISRTYGISQNTVYWFLVIDTLDDSGRSPPHFAIKHTSGHKYTFSMCETLAIVASMVTSEPWLFSLDQLPPASLNRWTETLLYDQAVFETAFQNAIRATMVPNFEIRLNKTNSDALAITNGHQAHRMPSPSILQAFTVRNTEARTMSITVRRDSDQMELDAAHPNDLETLHFKNLIREYSNVVNSYVNENCAYGTSYQLRDRPLETAAKNPSSASTKARSVKAFADRPDLTSSNDPTLMGGSARSSFRSFQSTHLRSKKILAQLPELEPMSLDTNVSSNFSRQFPLPVGVR